MSCHLTLSVKALSIQAVCLSRFVRQFIGTDIVTMISYEQLEQS